MSPILYSIAVAALYSSAASGSVWVTADKNGRRVILVVMIIYICIGSYACVVSDPVGLIIIAYTIFGIFFWSKHSCFV